MRPTQVHTHTEPALYHTPGSCVLTLQLLITWCLRDCRGSMRGSRSCRSELWPLNNRTTSDWERARQLGGALSSHMGETETNTHTVAGGLCSLDSACRKRTRARTHTQSQVQSTLSSWPADRRKRRGWAELGRENAAWFKLFCIGETETGSED